MDGAKKKVEQQFTANIREVEKAEPRDLVSDGDEQSQPDVTPVDFSVLGGNGLGSLGSGSLG